jgi:hypothetical protein
MNKDYKEILNYLYCSNESVELSDLYSHFANKKEGEIFSHIKYMQTYNLVNLTNKTVELNFELKNICSILVEDIPDREKAFKICIQHVQEESSVNTLWAYSIVFGENKPQPHHLHRKLSAKLIESNQYAREKTGDTFEITKDPGYQLRTSTLSINRATKIAFLLTLVIGAISTAATIKSCQISNQQYNENIEVKSKDLLIEQLNNKISQKDSILNSLSVQINSLNNEIDSLKKNHH